MIDERNEDRTGWARFSDDKRMRYRLSRVVSDRAKLANANPLSFLGIFGPPVELATIFDPVVRIVFVMLNPSTADAFVLDPTVRRCVNFARAWGADVLEVVNIFALRSTDPKVLYDGARVAAGQCGDYSHAWCDQVGADAANECEIVDACTGATRVIAAWGTHGALAERGTAIKDILHTRGIMLEHLGLTKDGHPRHPLYVKGNTAPEAFT